MRGAIKPLHQMTAGALQREPELELYGIDVPLPSRVDQVPQLESAGTCRDCLLEQASRLPVSIERDPESVGISIQHLGDRWPDVF